MNRIWIVGVLSFIGFVWISLTYESRFIIQIDEWLIAHIQQWESNGLTNLAKVLSFIGSGWMVVGLSLVFIVWLLLLKRRAEILIFMVTIAGSTIVNNLLKELYERLRPQIHPIIVENGYSFPSGHSMAALSLYGIILILLWRFIHNRTGRTILVIASLLIILSIGLSRVYLGVHYPSDIIGGYLASGAWLMLVIYAAQVITSYINNNIIRSRDGR